MPWLVLGMEHSTGWGDIVPPAAWRADAAAPLVIYSCGTAPDFFCWRQAMLIKQSLELIGIRARVRMFPALVMIARTFRKGEPWDIALLDWGADFADSSSFLDLLEPSVGERWQNRIDEADRLSLRLATPPSASWRSSLPRRGAVGFVRERDARAIFSARMGCQVFQPVYGMDLGTLGMRR